VTKTPVTKKVATQQLDTSSDDSDGGPGSPEGDVSDDYLHVLLRSMGIDMIATKVKNHQQHLKDTTKDLRICGKEGTGSHPVKNTTVKGWYCKFCL
jgi:hypothetical protein